MSTNTTNNINNANNRDNTNNTSNTNNRNTNTNTNTEVGSTFIALEVSYRLIAALRDVVPVIKKQDRDLADQIQRAASSVCLNLAEGQRSIGGNRGKHYAFAHGSANEVKAGLFVAKAWGWIAPSDEALAVLDRLLALLWRLTHAS